MELGNSRDVLEVFVQNVEEAVCKAPEEEEGRDEDEACPSIFAGHGCADNRHRGGNTEGGTPPPAIVVVVDGGEG